MYLRGVKDVSGKKIRIRPSRMYVDLPAEIGFFAYSYVFHCENSGVEITYENLKEEWNKFLLEKLDIMIDGKPVAQPRLKSNHNTKTVYIQVNWDLFLRYLENKAEKYIDQVKQDGRAIRQPYNDIIENSYLSIHEIAIVPRYSRLSEREYINLKKVLIYTEDYYVTRYFNYLANLIDEIFKNLSNNNKFVEKVIYLIKTYILDLFSNFDILSIPACYTYLRSILEQLIKLVVYINISKNFDNIDEVLGLLYWSDRIKGKGRNIYSHSEFESWKKKIIKAINRANSGEKDEKQKLEIIKNELFNISRKFIEIVCKEYYLHGDLDNVWTACSEIVHNQHPLPFYSLLEIKVFKKFLEYYISKLEKAFSSYIHPFQRF